VRARSTVYEPSRETDLAEGPPHPAKQDRPSGKLIGSALGEEFEAAGRGLVTIAARWTEQPLQIPQNLAEGILVLIRSFRRGLAIAQFSLGDTPSRSDSLSLTWKQTIQRAVDRPLDLLENTRQVADAVVQTQDRGMELAERAVESVGSLDVAQPDILVDGTDYARLAGTRIRVKDIVSQYRNILEEYTGEEPTDLFVKETGTPRLHEYVLGVLSNYFPQLSYGQLRAVIDYWRSHPEEILAEIDREQAEFEAVSTG
jgi:uncharacterized protein (DUF433 family)